MLDAGRVGLAVGYAAASVAAGYAAVHLATLAVRRVRLVV
jgi:fluoride ion exporter CrcB/FEX